MGVAPALARIVNVSVVFGGAGFGATLAVIPDGRLFTENCKEMVGVVETVVN